ncbi:SMP-30/gluconolactonase/LRE family protein [Aridibaculum aurantiacum]|uniref:SMP-30/gluconolactonase/LRE family protein n=1 Tax=Aridibaculum aurantiacum TaxID=2810307 RepID=UPI001A97320A|nr:SMP-30/gluconolactonase/LRE family protein [Aridibaculum aurantiacum]
MNYQVEVEYNAGAVLGEGALWHLSEKKVYWVDIEKCLLHIYDPATKENKSFSTNSKIGTVVPVTGGGALVALQKGLHFMDTTTGELKFFNDPIQDGNIRFNDGKCDPAGRFWVGTMHLETKPGVAKLYMLDHDLSVHSKLEGLSISNGITWSSDGRKMFFIDTPTKEVVMFDYDITSGNISNKKVVVTIPGDSGLPDGMTIDAEDKLWVALYGGGAICRFDPISGEMLQKVEVPAPKTTSCAFGGPDLKTLFITTATDGMDKEDLEKYPLSGSLFSVETEVAGVAASFFELRQD